MTVLHIMSKLYKAQTQQGHSRAFFEYIRSVGESKSKQEEDQVVARDVADLKRLLSSKNIDKRFLNEYVVRIFYAEMLGHSAEFGHIHCVNLSSSPDLLFKRTGYLGTWLTVNPDHNLMYLIVSNLQRDMKSSNFLHVAAALTAASKLVRPELMSAINTEVVGLLNHTNALVRKKVVVAMHAFYKRSDGLILDQQLFRQALCDRDPSVMGAALYFLRDVVISDPASHQDLIPTLTSILTQIMKLHLSRDYDYHSLPSPWLQMHILRILSILIGDNISLAHKCEGVIAEVMKRADTGFNIGYAVMCEVINVIARMPPIPSLIQLAAEAISKLLAGKNSNLRYVGIRALSQLARVDPKHAREHQQVVMACLEDADDTIRRMTMLLLIAMCNEDNVDIILTRLIKSLSRNMDKYVGQELTRGICDAAERFSLGAVWYINSMNKILLCAAEHVPQATIQGMLKLVVEGEGEDEAKDMAFRCFCVETYFNLLESAQKNLPEVFSQVAAWVIGEYGFLTKRVSRTMLIDRLCDMLERAENADTRGWIIMALMKTVAHEGSMPDIVEDLLERFKDSRSVSIQQRCYEFVELSSLPVLMKRVLPLDGCCEDMEVDEFMGFLDSFVQEALLAGAKPYEKRTVRLGTKEEDALRTEAYKVHRTDVVDESELDPEKFKTGEPNQLVIRSSARRWGMKNLLDKTVATEGEQEQLKLQTIDATEAASAAEMKMTGTMWTSNRLPDGCTLLHHVDPLAVAPRANCKLSKNERFLNGIFGGATKKTISTSDHTEMDEMNIKGRNVSEACSGSSLSIYMKHVKETEKIGFLVHILETKTVEHVVVATVVPPSYSLHVVSCTDSSVKTNKNGEINLDKLQANQALEISFQLVPTGFPTEGCLQVEATHRGAPNCEPQRASAFLELRPSDVLRIPSQMTTQQFGQTWLSLSGEYKLQLTSAAPLTPDSLQELLMTRASLRVVEVIRNEVIAASVLLGTGQPLLCHVIVVDPHTANVTVRANDSGFATYVANAISAV